MSRRAERVAKVIKGGGLLPIAVAPEGDPRFSVVAAIKIATRQLR